MSITKQFDQHSHSPLICSFFPFTSTSLIDYCAHRADHSALSPRGVERARQYCQASASERRSSRRNPPGLRRHGPARGSQASRIAINETAKTQDSRSAGYYFWTMFSPNGSGIACRASALKIYNVETAHIMRIAIPLYLITNSHAINTTLTLKRQ